MDLIDNGLTTTTSRYDYAETLAHLEESLRSRGMRIIARIDHALAAEQAGLTLEPTMLLIFGNASSGTLLMQSQRTVAIDLPLKALVWRDLEGRTSISYNQPSYLVRRHGAMLESAPILSSMTTLLDEVCREAAGQQAA